ncbi:unnamed protein product [Mycena citricolor]|uniref:C2H2-type domain-containing protein n=1 Tax=Mycena citricolor TaxID=2018698 RepID=A0AAD2HHL3_9AGAR|nr:unnamed protein product [Mycena citricolor]
MGQSSRTRELQAKLQFQPPPLDVVISEETVLNLAKYTLHLNVCEVGIPGPGGGQHNFVKCDQDMGCWWLFFWHQIKRHTIVKGKSFFQCDLTKCSARVHQSEAALHRHVESSHMKGVYFPCPFTDCRSSSSVSGRTAKPHLYDRERDLIHHIKTKHEAMIGMTLSYMSPLLLPSMRPRPMSLDPPPALPLDRIPVTRLRVELSPQIHVRTSGWQQRAPNLRPHMPMQEQSEASYFTLLPPQGATAGRIKAARRTKLSKASSFSELSQTQNLTRAKDENECEYDLAMLDEISWDETSRILIPEQATKPPFFDVHPRDKEFERAVTVSGPVFLPETQLPEHTPKISIFYNVLATRYYKQLADGEEPAA